MIRRNPFREMGLNIEKMMDGKVAFKPTPYGIFVQNHHAASIGIELVTEPEPWHDADDPTPDPDHYTVRLAACWMDREGSVERADVARLKRQATDEDTVNILKVLDAYGFPEHVVRAEEYGDFFDYLAYREEGMAKRHWPEMDGLSKLEKMANLIKEGTRGMNEIMPGVNDTFHVERRDDASICIGAIKTWGMDENHVLISFNAHVSWLGAIMDPYELSQLARETKRAADVVQELNLNDIRATPEELNVFVEGLRASQEQAKATQQDGGHALQM